MTWKNELHHRAMWHDMASKNSQNISLTFDYTNSCSWEWNEMNVNGMKKSEHEGDGNESWSRRKWEEKK